MAGQVNQFSLLEASLFHILRVEKDDPPAVVDSSIAIIQSVDSRVELIVAAHGHHQELPGLQFMARQLVDRKVRPSACGLKLTLARPIRKIEATWLAHPSVVVLETRNHSLD